MSVQAPLLSQATTETLNAPVAGGGVPYYETSARKRIGVDDVFYDLIRQMLKADTESGRLGGSRNLSGFSSGGGLGFGTLTGRKKNRRRKAGRNGPAGGGDGGGGHGPQCVVL